MLRTVFFGTPEFSIPTLAAMNGAGYAPALVVAQPDRPAGRGRRLVAPPVARWARQEGLPLAQPESVREPAFIARLQELAPDVAVVVAFGQIFRQLLLCLPRHGCINLHASLLPAYRGAAPIQAAIAAGDRSSGVSTMLMRRGLDSGPVLFQESLAIGPQENADELAPRLARLGAELTLRTLAALSRGEWAPQAQDDSAATYAPRLCKGDGIIDWNLPARRIYDRLRAYTPWPGVSSTLRGQAVKILHAIPLESQPEFPGAIPGAILGLRDDALRVACGDGTILLLERVQRPGKSPVSARDFYNGERLGSTDRLGSEA
jgi:methionyl-tRNA formyltransferase